jgi:tripartite-type tricarboxylate transporter receptor subunit TctC
MQRHAQALMFIRHLLWIVLAASAVAAQAAPSEFPARPVRILVPFTPGGATDTIARQLQARISELWAQPVIVDNRPGASGAIAFALAAKAPPDGHTLLVSSVSITILETTLAKTLTVKPSRDLAGVTMLIEVPHLFVVNPTIPATTVKELVEYVRKTGVRLNYAVSAVGTYTHLDAIRFLKAAGIDMTVVPYKGGAGQFMAAVMGNEAQFTMVNMASSIGHIRAGRMKALATTWPTRRTELPDVPTMAESGFPGIGTNAWNGLFTSANIPKPLLNRIHADVVKVMDSPAMKEQLARQHMSVVLSKTPAAFTELFRQEAKKWRQVVVENNITVE